MHEFFRKFSQRVSTIAGSPWSFALSVFVLIVWVSTGPIFNFSDTWQLIINTGTTIITFLMVFLIQNTQNRESKAIQLKLDEIIRALKNASNDLVDIEDLTDAELATVEKQYKELAAAMRQKRSNE